MNEKIKELYDEIYFESSSYGRQDIKLIERNYKNLLNEGLKYFPEILNKKNLKILDFGCAYGAGTNYLAKVFKNSIVVGVDISDYAVQKAKKLYSGVKNLDFYNLDLYQDESVKFLTDKYGYFDIIFTRDVLEHIPKGQQETIVKHCYVLLGKNGKILASIANGLNPYSYVCDKTHIGLRTPWFWKKLFKKYFVLVDSYEKNWIPFIWRIRKDKEVIEIKLPLFGFVIYLFAKKE